MRWGTLFFFLTGVAMMALTLLRLKRVEAGADFLYITDYFRHRSYPFTEVEKVNESNFLLLKIVTIHFKAAGTFGKRIPFIASGSGYREFFKTRPDLREMWVEE